MSLEFLKAVYEAFGGPSYPVVTFSLAVIIGAVVGGGAWRIAAWEYTKSLAAQAVPSASAPAGHAPEVHPQAPPTAEEKPSVKEHRHSKGKSATNNQDQHNTGGTNLQQQSSGDHSPNTNQTFNNYYGPGAGNLKTRAVKLANEMLTELRRHGVRITDPDVSATVVMSAEPSLGTAERKTWDDYFIGKYELIFRERVLQVIEDLAKFSLRDEMLDKNTKVMHDAPTIDPSGAMRDIAEGIKKLANGLPDSTNAAK